MSSSTFDLDLTSENVIFWVGAIIFLGGLIGLLTSLIYMNTTTDSQRTKRGVVIAVSVISMVVGFVIFYFANTVSKLIRIDYVQKAKIDNLSHPIFKGENPHLEKFVAAKTDYSPDLIQLKSPRSPYEEDLKGLDFSYHNNEDPQAYATAPNSKSQELFADLNPLNAGRRKIYSRIRKHK